MSTHQGYNTIVEYKLLASLDYNKILIISISNDLHAFDCVHRVFIEGVSR